MEPVLKNARIHLQDHGTVEFPPAFYRIYSDIRRLFLPLFRFKKAGCVLYAHVTLTAFYFLLTKA